MTKQITLFLFLGLIIISCTQQIDFEKEYLSKQLVLNSIITPDSTIKVKLYSTMSINEGYPIYVTDAEVLLFKNNEIVENLELKYHTITGGWNYEARRYNIDTIYHYQSTKTIAEAGNEYKLVVSHADYPTLTCKTVIPAAVPITHVDTIFTCGNNDMKDYATFYFICQIDDPGFTNNYYRFVVNSKGQKKSFHINREDEIIESFYEFKNNRTSIDSNDPVFRYETEDANNFFGASYNSFGIFGDMLFNGKKQNISFSTYDIRYSSALYDKDTPLCAPLTEGEYFHFTIELHHLSKDTYLYFKSIDAQQGTDHLSFIEPVQVYSNIENGVGIFGSYSVSKYEVTFGEYPVEGIENW